MLQKHINSVPQKFPSILTEEQLKEIARDGSVTIYLTNLRNDFEKLKKVLRVEESIYSLIVGVFASKKSVVKFHQIGKPISMN